MYKLSFDRTFKHARSLYAVFQQESDKDSGRVSSYNS